MSARRPARRAESGAPTAAIWAARAMRRSIRSTRGNFSKLQVAWRFKTDVFGVRPDYNLQTTPLMINGVLYATVGSRRDAVAIDAATGELLWMFRIDEGKRAAAAPRLLSGRGVAYWTDGKGDERIFMVTFGYQLVALDAKTGHSGPRVRPERHPRSQAEQRPGARSDHRRDWIEHRAHRRQRRRDRRRRASGRGCAAEQDERERVHPRLRREDRKAVVDLPHHSAAGRVRQRDVGERLVVVLGQYRHVGAVLRGRRARDRLHADRAVHRRLLRRPSSGQQPVHGVAGGGGPAHRKTQMALSARPSRNLGLRSSVRADTGRRHDRRQAQEDCRGAEQAGLPLRLRSPDRAARVADRRAARREGHRAGRMVFADAAVPDETSTVRASGRSGKGSDRLHARAACRGEEGRVEHQAGSALHSAHPARAKAARSGRRTSRTARTGREAHTIRKPESCMCTQIR